MTQRMSSRHHVHYSAQSILSEKHKEKLAYVAPKNIRLGRDKDRRGKSFQYILILETSPKLLTGKDVAQCLYGPQHPGVGGKLSDITDGLICKSNRSLSSERALPIVLYQDAFKVANPPGSARKKHKLVRVYYSQFQLTIGGSAAVSKRRKY